MKGWHLLSSSKILFRRNNSAQEKITCGHKIRSVDARQAHHHVDSAKKSRRRQVGKWAMITSAAIGVGGVIVWRQVFPVSPSIPAIPQTVLESNPNPYLYLESKIQDWKVNLMTWLKIRSDDPWVLLRVAQSPNQTARLLGVKALAAQHDWENDQYGQIAQACDNRTLIGLARSADVDQRYFLPPPMLNLDIPLEEDFRRILSSLPTSGVNRCIQYLTSNALRHDKATMEKADIYYLGSSGLEFSQTPSTMTAEKVERFFLEALAVHSTVSSHCKEIIQLGGLQLLQRLQTLRENFHIRRLVARIIGNLALHENLHGELITAGWVTVLADWVNSPDLSLSLHSSRALANLDQDSCENTAGRVFEDGVYLIHPRFRDTEPVYADVVFVHGLLGGPFKTWRQGQTTEDNNHQAESYTFCWPKDWLASDCPHLRIFSVEYDSNLSDWTARCPWESDIHSLQSRSLTMLEKLKKAGVGQRPIIWVGHSMGGLLIKKMIEDAKKDGDLSEIRANTRGFVFYSVPHRGSELASLSKQAAFLLYPSLEVQELYTDSPMLRSLHDQFVEFLKDHSTPCLSFGEMNKTSLGLKLKTVIVPPHSSDPGVGEYHPISTNHLNICKPESRLSHVYRTTLAFISECLAEHVTDNTVNDRLFEEEAFWLDFSNQ